MIQCVAMVKDWSKQDNVLTHLKFMEAMIIWYKGSNFILIVHEPSGKNAKNIWKLKILALCSSNLALCWDHLESFKIYWKLSPIPRDSDLMGVRCRLELRFLKFPQVTLMCSQHGVTSFHPKSRVKVNLIYHIFVIQH